MNNQSKEQRQREVYKKALLTSLIVPETEEELSLVERRELGKPTNLGMKGQIGIVTGANAGIGQATASGLAAMGATVVMVCRNPKRGKAAMLQIRKDTGNDSVHLIIADLSSFGSIRKLVRQFSDHYQNLHLLVNNAGIIPERRRVTVNGIEMQLAVNHLAPFLLTNLLLGALKSGAPSRIVTVASQVHSSSPLDFTDLQSDHSYVASQVYRRTKLANIMFTYELARRLEGTHITANCLHPGVIATDLLDNYMASSSTAGFANGSHIVGDTPTTGAKAVLHVATSPNTQDVNGKYFVAGKTIDSAPISYDQDQQRKLWDVSSQITGLNGNEF